MCNFFVVFWSNILKIMFVEQGSKRKNEFWRYLVGSLLIATASFVGQIPISVAILIKSFKNGSMPTKNSDVMHYFEPNLQLFLLLLTFVFAFAALYFVVTRYHEQTFLSVTTSRKSVDWSRVLFSFGLWATVSIGLTLYGYYSDPSHFQINFKPLPFAILCVIAILMIPIQTSTEEYLFRGYLMQGFANLSKNKWFPLLMTSVLFGSLHILNPEIEKLGYIVLIYYIGTGFLLGIITLMDEGMELALGFHAANNLVGALLITTDWGALQTNSIFIDRSQPNVGAEILVPIFILYPLLIFVFSKKYQWKNWTDKLTGKINTLEFKN